MPKGRRADKKLYRAALCMVKVKAQGMMLIVRFPKRKEKTAMEEGERKKRGTIKGFSKKSQSRLKRMLFSLDLERRGMHFITLTLRENFTHSQVRAFLRRLYRRWGRMPVIWRKEYQARGVVHYHMIVITRAWMDYDFLAEMWADVCGVDYYPQVKGVFIQEASPKLRAYILKYTSKGAPGCLTRERQAGAPSVLDEHDITGRFWGVENKSLLPYAPIVEVMFIPDFAREALRSYVSWAVGNGYRVDVVYLYFSFDCGRALKQVMLDGMA